MANICTIPGKKGKIPSHGAIAEKVQNAQNTHGTYETCGSKASTKSDIFR